MLRFKWLIGLLGVVLLATICLSISTEHRNAALADDDPPGLLKRIETLEARVAMLEGQLARSPRMTPLPPEQRPGEPRYWSKGEFNGAPVYIIPLGDAKTGK